jgi:hypothetical protein
VNELQDATLDQSAFAYRDILGQDAWQIFTPVFPVITLVGAPTYVGRYHIVGRQCFFQVTLLAATSIAFTAGTSYMTLPIIAKGLGGEATLVNLTTNIAVGVGVIDAINSRCWPPAQVASGNTFALNGWCEV